MADMKDKQVLAESLIDGWFQNRTIGWVKHRFFTIIGEVNFERLNAAFNINSTWNIVPARAAIRQNWRMLNDLLWDQAIETPAAVRWIMKSGWRREWPQMCVRSARKRAGMSRLIVSVRDRDTRRSWDVVK